MFRRQFPVHIVSNVALVCLAFVALSGCQAKLTPSATDKRAADTECSPDIAECAGAESGSTEPSPNGDTNETPTDVAVAAKLMSDQCIDPDLSAVRSDQILMLCDGTIAKGTLVIAATSVPENCSTHGTVGCVTTTTYKSADLTNVTPANIRTGITIAGVTGDYPSATHPLPGNDTAGTTVDLDLGNFDARMKDGVMSFEWWDSTGARYTNTGDGDIIASILLTLRPSSAWEVR